MKTSLLISFCIIASAWAIPHEDVPHPPSLADPPPPKVEPDVTHIEIPPPPPPPNAEEPPKSQCYDDKECKPYHYCFFNAFGPNSCVTYNKHESHWSSAYCRRVDRGESGKESNSWPDHNKCKEWEAKDRGLEDKKFATARCYESLGYTCHRSYLMPCTPNYDEEGNPIEGEEESCPEMFRCGEKTYGDKAYKMCLPIEPEESYASKCETRFDCGYSQLEGQWPICANGECIRAIQK